MPDANDVHAVPPLCDRPISIRDYFAAAALQGLLANGPNGGGPVWVAATAERAYQLADEMVGRAGVARHP
jgi:hypothetical protein